MEVVGVKSEYNVKPVTGSILNTFKMSTPEKLNMPLISSAEKMSTQGKQKQRSNTASDIVFRQTGMSVGYVAGTQREKPFGFDLYNAPAADHKYMLHTMCNFKEKRVNFAEKEGRANSWVPGPKYMGCQDWRKNIPLKTGCFLKKARTTFTEEVFKEKKALPAPNKYTNFKALEKRNKILGQYDG